MTTATLAESPPGRRGESGGAGETHGLTKRFESNIAVNDVELLVPRGCAFGYLGPNGAGKTTLIRVLLGLTHADAGTMFLLGHSVPRHRDVALARVGAIVDEPRFHGHLTGRQNLQILAAAREPAAKGRIEPAGMLDMRDMILSLVAEGRTVVLSSHLLDEVERTCDAVAIVDRGKVIRQGAISDLLAGSSFVVEVECSEPSRAGELIKGTAIGGRVEIGPLGLGITLAAGTGRDVIAEINRVLVGGGIAVYRLQEVQTSLESWFLQVTSRLGASE